jgi:FPC/CPF motif-containing protein YcgG
VTTIDSGDTSADTSAEQFADIIAERGYPCVGAKSAFKRGQAAHVVLDDMRDAGTPASLRDHLSRFGEQTDFTDGFHTFLASFRLPHMSTEAQFERHLWDLLQRVHDADEQPWDPAVSSDPSSPHFGFSVAGRAYFVIGLHPAASRVARRFPLPTLVFNAHEQFERLRADGRFDGLKETIRRRDEALQGEVNPMAHDHGDASEALQYSGRRQPGTWTPPLVVHDRGA